MEEKTNVWKANVTNGVIFGMVAVIYTLMMYFFDLILNPMQGYISIVIQIVLLWYLLKSYRDNYCFGAITYGQSVGAGVIICLYGTIISVVFMYFLYTVIDTTLLDRMLAFSEETMMEKGFSQTAIDAGMRVQRKLMTPGIMTITGIFSGIFGGTIMSLIVSIFIKRESNPLIDNYQQY
jgi:hypothetical protein